jgi:flagellar basal body P-ring formation protein FlgA
MTARLLALLLASAAVLASARDESAPSASPLAQEQFIALIARELSSHFNLEGELQLELIRPWSPPEALAGGWQIQVLEYPAVPAASMLLRCRILGDGRILAEPTILLRAALWRDAWLARQPVTHGATFDPTLLETRRVDLLRDRDALPAVVGDRSFIFTRSVQAGRLLTWRDVGRRPLVRKGELVEVSASDGQLIIMMKALAMQNGAQGEVVTVRNLDSRKDFSAFVIDENRVQVRF